MHYCVLVAVDVVDPSDRAEIAAAVRLQMKATRAQSWFDDGFLLGGRYSGRLSSLEHQFDPRVFTLYGGNVMLDIIFADGVSLIPDTLRQNSARPFGDDIAQVKAIRSERFRPPYAFVRNQRWYEPDYDGDGHIKWEAWEENFFRRFIDPLGPEVVLVVLDCHA